MKFSEIFSETLYSSHQLWLRGKTGGIKANLGEADLWKADLRGAYLGGADLGRLTVLQIGPIGSRKDYLVYKYGKDIDEVQIGCWCGTLEEFSQRVLDVHANNPYGQVYQIIIEAVKRITLEIKAEGVKP